MFRKMTKLSWAALWMLGVGGGVAACDHQESPAEEAREEQRSTGEEIGHEIEETPGQVVEPFTHEHHENDDD